MELNGIANQINQFILDQGGYWDIPWLLAALIEEMGELSKILQVDAGIRSRATSNQKKSLLESIEEETGDILFALICLTNYYNIDLEIAVSKTLEKYKSRILENRDQGTFDKQ